MSTLNVSRIRSLSSGTPPEIGDNTGAEYGRFCRAFVNFDGTGTIGGNQPISSQFNVRSVLKNASGDYTINFTNSFSDTNYCVVTNGGPSATTSNGDRTSSVQSLSTNSVTIWTKYQSNSNGGAVKVDSSPIFVAVFR